MFFIPLCNDCLRALDEEFELYSLFKVTFDLPLSNDELDFFTSNLKYCTTNKLFHN